MTLLLSWLGVDSRGPASIYIASDSRISWGNSCTWDYGRKVFGFKNHPDILGYCGNVLFASQVLSQIIDIGDEGLLFDSKASCKEKFEAIKEKIIQIFKFYPDNIKGDSLVILHASRDSNVSKYSKQLFFCHKIEWERSKGWSGKPAKFNDYSDTLLVLGSGKNEFLKKFKEYQKSKNQKTSRAVFHCFCDTLSSIKDKYCGGVPQLVDLYRIGNSKNFGIIKSKKRYLLGVNITNLTNFNNIEWRNELFEVCDGNTMERFPEAQKQPNPVNSQ